VKAEGADVKHQHKTLVVWLAFLAVIVVIWTTYAKTSQRQEEARFGELVAAIEKGDVAEVRIRETGKGVELSGSYKSGTRFVTLGVVSEELLKKLDAAQKTSGTTYTIEPKDDGAIWIVLVQWLPMVLIVVLFLFFIRQVQAGGGKAMSFGKSRARLMNESQNKVTFADVAGVDESKVELEEIVQFLKDPKKFTRLGGRIPKGVLLMGPPGTGKTLLARAIAGEAGVPFFSIAGSDFVEMFVGVGASRVRDLFEQGKKNAPCIIFIDEIDAVGRHRGAGMGGGHDEREQTLNQLLVEMDGFESSEGVIIVAATNRPDVLDPAILRPGRFDRRIVVPRPDVTGREAIFRVHTRKTPLSTDVDIEVLARMTPGMSGADIENLVNEAALIAARRDAHKVSMQDFEAARDKITMGNERRSLVMTAKELEATAYHEAGHALVGLLLGQEDQGKRGDFLPLHKVTIIPRGAALGVTSFLPDDRKSMNKHFAENRIAMAMGGRIAEELLFGDINSGAASDIDHATELARAMVTEWGMSEKLGPLNFGQKQGEVFLGRDFVQQQNYSEQTSQTIDAEVRTIVMAQYDRARALLSAHMEKLHGIARALLEYETLDGEDLKVILGGGSITRSKPTVKIKTREQIEDERKKRDAAGKAPTLPLGGPTPEPAT
jgi:cell division protease FtsH